MIQFTMCRNWLIMRYVKSIDYSWELRQIGYKQSWFFIKSRHVVLKCDVTVLFPRDLTTVSHRTSSLISAPRNCMRALISPSSHPTCLRGPQTCGVRWGWYLAGTFVCKHGQEGRLPPWKGKNGCCALYDPTTIQKGRLPLTERHQVPWH